MAYDHMTGVVRNSWAEPEPSCLRHVHCELRDVAAHYSKELNTVALHNTCFAHSFEWLYMLADMHCHQTQHGWRSTLDAV